jgi:hypothetical protein
MNFFNFEAQGESGVNTWSLSHDFWLYWVVTIPLTLSTMAVWILWFNHDLVGRILCGWTGGDRKAQQNQNSISQNKSSC